MRWRDSIRLKWAERRKRVRKEKWLMSLSEPARMMYLANESIEKHPPPRKITIDLKDIPLEERRRQGLPLD
jgi:hypothetical protein